MKIKRMDNRFRACKDWGYMYQVTFASHQWREFYALKAQAKSIFDESTEIFPNWMWREHRLLLRTAPWAYHYDISRKPGYMYFRTEEHMSQCLMMLALTKQV